MPQKRVVNGFLGGDCFPDATRVHSDEWEQSDLRMPASVEGTSVATAPVGLDPAWWAHQTEHKIRKVGSQIPASKAVYPEEFRVEAVRLVKEGGKPLSRVAPVSQEIPRA